MRAATEDLYDGEFARYMTDNEGKPCPAAAASIRLLTAGESDKK